MELLEPRREIWEGLLLAIEPIDPSSEICDGLLLFSIPKLAESTSFEFLLASDILELLSTSESSGGDMDELLRLDSLVGEPEILHNKLNKKKLPLSLVKIISL